MYSGSHKLSENIWFIWSKTSYGSGEKVGCHDCDGQTDDAQNVKIEQNSGFRICNMTSCTIHKVMLKDCLIQKTNKSKITVEEEEDSEQIQSET